MKSPLQLRRIRALTRHLTSVTSRGAQSCPVRTRSDVPPDATPKPPVEPNPDNPSPRHVRALSTRNLNRPNHPVLAHVHDMRHPIKLAPTSLAEGPNAPRSRSGMAQEAKKCANLVALESPATLVVLIPKCLRHPKI